MNVEGQTVGQEARPDLFQNNGLWAVCKKQKLLYTCNVSFRPCCSSDLRLYLDCDWYVELTKPVLNDAEVSVKLKYAVYCLLWWKLLYSSAYAVFDRRNLANACTSQGGPTIMTAQYPIPEQAMNKLKQICNGFKVWLVRYSWWVRLR